jgi:hypothetical protein
MMCYLALIFFQNKYVPQQLARGSTAPYPLRALPTFLEAVV